MKYFLSTSGKKCCEECTWLLSLARKENGYDLIQIKRGFSENRGKMKLYPGEPAIIMDTGEFYIGDANGKPILINPSGGMVIPNAGNILCIRNKSEWSQGDTVEVSYSDMITSDGITPISENDDVYSCAVILNAMDVPVGIAFKVDWNHTDTSATFIVGYFNYTELVEFTRADVDAIIQHAEEEMNNEV